MAIHYWIYAETISLPGESISFDYIIPQPILADSIGKAPCTPDSILVYYPKKIKCSSITASGSDFSVTGPTPVTVIGASGNCINGESEYIAIKLSAPIYTKGTYTVTIQPGIDGSPIFDVCGQPILPQTLQFHNSRYSRCNFSKLRYCMVV